MPFWIVLLEWLARFVMVGLVGLSIWSISIILERRRFFAKLDGLDDSNELVEQINTNDIVRFENWLSQKEGGLRAETLRVALKNKNSGQVDRSVFSFLKLKRSSLEKGLSNLGTLGSTTPFVGLLGTILGIIVSFGLLSEGKIESNKVMLALGEALILTAIGLAVAIPATVAYNHFATRLRRLLSECESLKDHFISKYSTDS